MTDETNTHGVPLSDAAAVRVAERLFQMRREEREQRMEHLLQQKRRSISEQALARMGKASDDELTEDELTEDEYDTYDYLLLEMSHGV